MADNYEIRKDMPIPRKIAQKGPSLSGALRRMAYGNSITIPISQQASIHTCARSVGAKVKTQKNADGTVTVWRIDRPGDAEPRHPISARPRSQPQPQPNPSPTVPAAPLATSFKSAYETTRADPAMGLPAGYYEFQPYGPRLWREGPPPDAPKATPDAPEPEPGPAGTDIFS